jgi:pyruvate/2-oxoacid:ferredoxin oxidoreductase beta subunit
MLEIKRTQIPDNYCSVCGYHGYVYMIRPFTYNRATIAICKGCVEIMADTILAEPEV